jgi:hypothetical protein
MCVATYALRKLAEAKFALQEWSEFVEKQSPPSSVAEQELWNSVTSAIAHVDDDEEAILVAYHDLRASTETIRVT